MLETHLRPIYQKWMVDPIAQRIQHYRLSHPMFITFLAILAGISSGFLIYLNEKTWMIICLLLSGYLDTLDGTLARLKQISSAKGAVLDIVGDRIVEFAVILGLYSVSPATRGFASMWMLGSNLICITSFLLVGIFVTNQTHKGFHYSVGLMERAEAFLFFIVMAIKPEWFLMLAWIYTGLVLLTAGIRLFQFLKGADVRIKG